MGAGAQAPTGQEGTFEGPQESALWTAENLRSLRACGSSSGAWHCGSSARGSIPQPPVPPEGMRRGASEAGWAGPQLGRSLPPSLLKPALTGGLGVGQCQGPVGGWGCPFPQGHSGVSCWCPLIVGQEGGPWCPLPHTHQSCPVVWVSSLTSEACREGLPHRRPAPTTPKPLLLGVAGEDSWACWWLSRWPGCTLTCFSGLGLRAAPAPSPRKRLSPGRGEGTAQSPALGLGLLMRSRADTEALHTLERPEDTQGPSPGVLAVPGAEPCPGETPPALTASGPRLPPTPGHGPGRASAAFPGIRLIRGAWRGGAGRAGTKAAVSRPPEVTH